jgi:hypothetical protein
LTPQRINHRRETTHQPLWFYFFNIEQLSNLRIFSYQKTPFSLKMYHAVCCILRDFDSGMLHNSSLDSERAPSPKLLTALAFLFIICEIFLKFVYFIGDHVATLKIRKIEVVPFLGVKDWSKRWHELSKD